MSNTSFRMFSSAAKASIKPASMPVKTRSAYNMSSMLQELNDIEARYKGPANAANMTLDELWDDYLVRYRRAGPVLMWREPWMPEEKCEPLPYETPKAPKPKVSQPETPKPREYYLQMVLFVPPETDEEKPEETEDKPANASEATPKPATLDHLTVATTTTTKIVIPIVFSTKQVVISLLRSTKTNKADNLFVATTKTSIKKIRQQ
ncbi:hypothetical protein KCU77_g4025, partial [Aureobasidium melanogenum]